MTADEYKTQRAALEDRAIADMERLRQEFTRAAVTISSDAYGKTGDLARIQQQMNQVGPDHIGRLVALDDVYRYAGGTPMGESERLAMRTLVSSRPDIRMVMAKHQYGMAITHFSEAPGAHNFTSGDPQAACTWCGRTRRAVKFDDLPPECAARPASADAPMSLSILAEEKRYFQLLERAEMDVPAIIAQRGMSGETLEYMHATLGYDPEVVDSVVPVPKDMLVEYERRREEARALSRQRQVRTVVTVAQAPAGQSQAEERVP